MATLESLEKEAAGTVARVRNDPEGRLALRERFYHNFDRGPDGGPGFGRSELDFIRWEIARGVLKPIEAGGSPWWRFVNERLLYHAELAALIHEQLPDAVSGIGAVRYWLDFIREPSAIGWYRAHNASIVDGYLDAVELAHAEPWSERIWVNVVLYRLLYAQGLVEGVALGRLGEILSDPIGPSVDVLVHIPAFYPDKYPLSRREVQTLLQKSHRLLPELAGDFDDLFVIPELASLYADAASWLGQTGLELLLRDGKPCYPAGDAREPSGGPDHEPPPKPGPKRRIAILGGGLASLSAAYELTSYDGWRDRYEVTLYQIGWRLGGKTSNGFGPGDRIEERGIHIFQGWYQNAFRMVQDAYAYMEAHHLAEGSPLPKWTDAFVPDDATLFTELDRERGVWTNWPVLFPYDKQLPGTAGPPPVHEILREAVGLFAELVLGSPYQAHQGCLSKLLAPELIEWFFTPPWEKSAPDWWKHASNLADERHGAIEKREVRWLKQAAELLGQLKGKPMVQLGPFEVSALRVATELFAAGMAVLRLIAPADTASESRLAHIVVLGEFGLANLRGVLADVYDEKTSRFDFHRINDFDYRDWLLSHGLPSAFADSAPVRFIYCGAFHNLFGDAPGKLAADMGVRSLLASVTYRGSLVWKLTAGTGGSLTAPLYKMLSHRGVRFEFFHDVEEIHWSPGDEIESITVGVQAELNGKDEYEPLVNVKGLDGWPSHPLYAQLEPEQARRLEHEHIDLESPWSPWKPVKARVLRRGVDFDDIVLGIPIGATAKICSSIVEHSDAWKKMVDQVRTTPTLGVQLWLRPTLADLGMDLPQWGMSPGDEPNSVIYADLLYSWTDMGLVLPFEGWPPEDIPGQLSYYCGTWPLPGPLPPYSDHGFPARERKRLMDYSRRWLGENMGWFWPEAIKSGNQFDLSLLVDPYDPQNERDASGDDRFAAQWFVANIEPTNHYTLAWPGTDRYRLRADQSGFENLFLCGDWTNFGLNIGHVEGAVTSGLLAAQAALKASQQGDARPIFAQVGSPEAG